MSKKLINSKPEINGNLKCDFINLLILLALIIFPVVTFAQQETGQIAGLVTDSNGAVVANASVAVKNINNGRTTTAQSNSEGAYTLPNLQPGTYEIIVTAQGFQSKTERVQVTVGSKLTLNTQLGITAQVNTVDVPSVGGVAEVNTTDQQVSNIVTTKQILELPTLTRNPYDLVGLSGNISDGDAQGSTSRGVGASINGQRSASTNILLDGVENVDLFGAGIGQQTPLDSVGEFRVVTSNFSAENGRASGGIINAVTKSGTNAFHGTGYDFNRNSALASNSFENNSRGNPRAQFNRNQFGYSVGGPILKNRLFFFNSTEWTRVRSQNTATAFIPTQAFINASNVNTRNYFSKFGALASNVKTTGITFGTDPRVGGGTVPLFQQVSFTIPSDAGAGFPANNYSTVSRIDYNLSSKTQIFGRYALERLKPFAGNYGSPLIIGVSPYQGFTIGTTDRNQNMLVSAAHEFTPNFITQTKVSYSRQTSANTLGADPNTPTLAGSFANSSGLPVYFPGFLSTAPGIALPTNGTQHLTQIDEDLTYITGNHNFRFGGEYVYIRDNQNFPAFQNAVETLGANQNQVVNNFINGTLTTFQAAVNPQGKFPGQSVTLPVSPPSFSRSNRYNEFAFYINDSWRLRPRLTLNLGLRYEYYGVQRNSDPTIESNFFFGSGATFQDQIRNGSIQTTTQSGGLWKPDKNNFAPRVGFAWDLFGNGKTSIRGGYGTAYERNFGNVTFNVIQNPPAYAVLALAPADVGGTLPIYTTSTGPLSGSGVTKVLGRTSLRAVDPNIKNAYAHFYSASFEREISKGTVASVTFSGSNGRELYSIANINRADTGLRFLNSKVSCAGLSTSDRLNCQYSNINFRGNQGYSNYAGVTFALDSNNLFGLGITTTNHYTYSKAKDNLSSTFSDGYQAGTVLGFLDPFNPSLDYGDADFDVRHRFVSSFIYEVPIAKYIENKFLKNALGGFQLTGIVNIQSGTPFTIYDCTNATLTTCLRFTPTAPISFGAPSKLISNGDANSFIYTDLRNQTASAFDEIKLYPTGTGGDEAGPFPSTIPPRNSFRGPGFWNLTLGLYKNITFTERLRLQLRAEAFNVLNHSNFGLNTGSFDISGTSFVTASKFGTRNIQLAAKIIF